MSKIEYEQVGDYQIPNIKSEEPLTDLGKFGKAYLEYLKTAHPGHLMALRIENKLNNELVFMEKQMMDRYEVFMKQMMEVEGVTEKLKEKNQMEWVRIMNNLDKTVQEMVLDEFIQKNK